jgi:hypothetical protein
MPWFDVTLTGRGLSEPHVTEIEADKEDDVLGKLFERQSTPREEWASGGYGDWTITKRD